MTVLTTESIAQSLRDVPATNGWDAVFAMNLKQVNALFFQQFLDVGPTNTRAETFLRFALADDESLLVLDAGLGPAELSLQLHDAKATVEMELITGVLITLKTDPLAIVSAAWVRPNESTLTGSLELAKVTGEVSHLGKVVMDLGASSYTPTIGGVQKSSLMLTKLGEAARTYFHYNAATYTLGIIGNKDVSPSLTPTAFHITTQQHPTKQDSCVLILIQTNGQPGTVGPLARYPIPDDCGAALLIAEPPLFNALSDDLNKSFQSFGTSFSVRQGLGGSVFTVGSGGQIDCGAYGQQYNCSSASESAWDNSDKTPWTSDSAGNPRSVQIGLDGLTISAIQGQLVLRWVHSHSQWLSQLYRNISIGGGRGGIPPPSVCAVQKDMSTLYVNFKVSGTAAVDPGSSKVSFNFANPLLILEPQDYPNFWSRLWGGVKISDGVINALKSTLLGRLMSVPAVNIDAFRLKCLLFQSADTVKLTGAALPKGVYLTGNAAMPLSVTPASTSVQPGGTVQFSVAGLPSSGVMWEIKPRDCGSINRATGLYTAPASISSAQVVVVTAINKSDTGVHGSAMAVVYQSPAAHGVSVLPGRSLVTPGHHVKLYATDRLGAPLNVSWMLSPNVGSIAPGFAQGEYVYTAPSQLSQVTEVTASAQTHVLTVADGTAVIQLVPSTGITVQPAEGSVKFGAKLALTATVRAGEPRNLRWVVFPSGSGKVEFDLGDPTKATYTAPASLPKSGNQVHILAYLVDLHTAGVGSALITLTS